MHEDLSELTVLTDLKHINRLNWELLPKGKMPWEKVEEHLNPILKQLKNTKKPADEARLRHIYSYNPTTVFYGKSGFNGYVGFEFKEFTILESLLYGNAIYAFDKDCLELTKLTKKEILDDNLHIKRIIHKRGWEKEVMDLFKN